MNVWHPMDAAGAEMALVEFSRYIDDNQPDEGLTTIRLAKIAEQAGEALGAHIREQGRNILKEDYTFTESDVAARVLSVAFCALAAYEHLTDHAGTSMSDLITLTGDMLAKALAEPPSGV